MQAVFPWNNDEIMTMLIFLTGSVIWLGALVGAGYSHYRYRVRNDRIYREQLGREYMGGTW
ncbi:hypothetical protein SAMN06295970_104305 [Noviherbaspirillum suwonense]|jgi:hypothetical protein|uniref:Uncharacterized protein n=1 Tax=Noviherbaspirillum suwonense TaxID=1224511 RepID=A0ABY1Q2V2_9BURK|nr:hypothetical protein SAMN06295970_104305 [Noviherbaspirillum suwonense]